MRDTIHGYNRFLIQDTGQGYSIHILGPNITIRTVCTPTIQSFGERKKGIVNHILDQGSESKMTKFEDTVYYT